jgi:hypothetical protein
MSQAVNGKNNPGLSSRSLTSGIFTDGVTTEYTGAMQWQLLVGWSPQECITKVSLLIFENRYVGFWNPELQKNLVASQSFSSDGRGSIADSEFYPARTQRALKIAIANLKNDLLQTLSEEDWPEANIDLVRRTLDMASRNIYQVPRSRMDRSRGADGFPAFDYIDNANFPIQQMAITR